MRSPLLPTLAFILSGCGLVLDADLQPTEPDAEARLDVGTDTGPPDSRATMDASVDGCVSGSSVEIVRADLGSGSRSGAVIDSEFYSGWHFEIPSCGMAVSDVGFFGGSTLGGRFFAALVALDDPTVPPVAHDLTGPDVLATSVFRLQPESADVTIPLSVTLTPGWYAVYFGSGAFGADADSRGSIEGGHVERPGVRTVSTLRQSDGAFILQAGEYRLFLHGAVP